MELKDPGKLEFDAEILSASDDNPSGGGAFVLFPYDVQELFGTRGPVKVKATFDGVEYRGSLVYMGLKFHMLGVTKDIRKKIGKQPGDPVKVTVERDVEPRVVEIPADLLTAFSANPAAREFFDTLSYSHQREYVLWITDAKRNETRQERIEKTIEMLLQNRKLK